MLMLLQEMNGRVLGMICKLKSSELLDSNCAKGKKKGRKNEDSYYTWSES